MVQTNRTSSCTLQWTYNSKVLLNQMVLNLSKLARTPASIPDQVPCQLQSSVIPFSAIFMAILSPPILLNSVVEVSKVLNQVVAPGSGPLVSYPLVKWPSCWPLVYLPLVVLMALSLQWPSYNLTIKINIDFSS